MQSAVQVQQHGLDVAALAVDADGVLQRRGFDPVDGLAIEIGIGRLDADAHEFVIVNEQDQACRHADHPRDTGKARIERRCRSWHPSGGYCGEVGGLV
ncbi:MAG: hypothetical protein QM686_21020, partial [Herbaspirillum sp.]